MTDIEKKEARERILETAISLFARKGFAAIGVREIAEKADVNIAMISYYFQGKVGILKSIMEQFFDIYIQNFNVIENEKADLDECLRKLIYNLIYLARIIHKKVRAHCNVGAHPRVRPGRIKIL